MPRKKRTEFEANGQAVCYLRVSTGEQKKSGLGLMSQGSICARKAVSLGLMFRQDVHHDYLSPPRPGFFVDAAESAYKTKLAKRAGGGKMMECLQKGDTLIVARLDRAFRSVVDFVEVSTDLIERGIRLVCCSPAIDLGTASGRLQARMLASLAEWESDRKSERIIAALAAKKARGSPHVAKTPKKAASLSSDYRKPANVKFEPPATDQPSGRIFIYIRCSHRDSVESGLGMIVQSDICRAYAATLTAMNPNLTLAEVFIDPGVSAAKTLLRERFGGGRMHNELKKDDHVVFSTLDRGFRCVQDMAATLPDWEKRGVHVHFAGEGFSMDDPQGRMLAGIMVVFAQWETDIAADRARESRAQLEVQGKYVGGKVPPFWKIQERRGQRKLVISKRKILGYRLVRFLAKVCGMKIVDAVVRAEEIWADREKRPAIPQTGLMKWTKASAQLPKHYPRDVTGRAFPMFTVNRYLWAHRHYEEAMKAWRKHVAIKQSSTRPTMATTQ